VDLSEFRVGGEVEVEPTPKLKAGTTVLAFDQTIRHTGWCVVRADERSLVVLQRGMLQTKPIPDKKGWEDTIPSAVEMHEQIHGVIVLHSEVSIVLHEAPPAKGFRIESSAMAALDIHLVCKKLQLPVEMIHRQRISNRLTGNGNAKKAVVAAALRSRTWITGVPLRNEHEYDAMAVAVGYLVEE
jgi:Holliday junction resolvasome RuvABC endonuclease subunit